MYFPVAASKSTLDFNSKPWFTIVGWKAALNASSRTGWPMLSNASMVHTDTVPATTGTLVSLHSIWVWLPRVTLWTVTFWVAPIWPSWFVAVSNPAKYMEIVNLSVNVTGLNFKLNAFDSVSMLNTYCSFGCMMDWNDDIIFVTGMTALPKLSDIWIKHVPTAKYGTPVSQVNVLKSRYGNPEDTVTACFWLSPIVVAANSTCNFQTPALFNREEEIV